MQRRKKEGVMRKRNEAISDITSFVVSNTGMTEEKLIYDNTEYAFPALKTGADMIFKWISEGKRFFCFADYDVDGITSGESMRMLLLALKVPSENIVIRFPKRFSEGYGMTRKAVEEEFLPNEVCITVDNGISAFDAIKAAKEKGMNVIVTDHHLASVNENGEKLYPEADYIIDPNAIDGQAEFNGYCGCGIVLKLAEYMLHGRETKESEVYLARIRVLAAIATIADSVRLVEDNRKIVKTGLNLLTKQYLMTKGMNALLGELFLGSHISETEVAFRIAPALNASGRLYDEGAEMAAKLIRYNEDQKTASSLAQQQIKMNEERKTLQRIWTEKAEMMVEKKNHIVLYLDGCPEGIIGIVAGQLAERHRVPAIVFAGTGGELKGSGRSVDGINIKALLDKCSTYLLRYGGHAAAAGLSIKKESFHDFKDAFEIAIGEWKPSENELFYDLQIEAKDVPSIIEDVQRFSPYGEGNPMPVFLIKNVTLTPNGGTYYKELKSNGIKLFSAYFNAASFTCHDTFMKMGCPKNLNLLGTMSQKYFGGRNIAEVNFTEFEKIEKEIKKTPLQMLLDKKAKAKEENKECLR